jgi:hypothetical protein
MTTRPTAFKIARNMASVGDPNAPTVVIAVPFGGRYVPPEWAMQLVTLSIPMMVHLAWVSVKGIRRDVARERLTETAIRAGARYILMIDDDVCVPTHTVAALLYVLENSEDDVAFCGAIYCTKTSPPVPCISSEIGAGPFWRWKTGEIFEIPYVGTGCLMIRASIFQKLQKPWFQEGAGESPMAEDFYFCKKVQSAGLKGLAHGGVLCAHFGEAGSLFVLPEDSYPVKNGSVDPRSGFGFAWT